MKSSVGSGNESHGVSASQESQVSWITSQSGGENFNREAVTRELKARGVTLEDNLDAGFHIINPKGIGVQIVGA
jgi:hypothetical protein